MEQSLYNILGITKIQLNELLENCYEQCQKNHRVFILDDLYDCLKAYVEKHMLQPIDEVLFVHFSRRLNDNEDDNGYSLKDVLTRDTTLSSFLETYGITFTYEHQRIRMYVNHCEIDVHLHKEYPYVYLNQLFDETFKNYPFSGYAFMDDMQQGDAYEIASGGPAFFGYLYPFIEDDDALIDEFINKSSFYQFTYVVPMKDVYFDDYEDLSEIDKQYHMIVKTLQRIYFYRYDNQFNEGDNTVLKMNEQTILSEKYLVQKIRV